MCMIARKCRANATAHMCMEDFQPCTLHLEVHELGCGLCCGGLWRLSSVRQTLDHPSESRATVLIMVYLVSTSKTMTA